MSGFKYGTGPKFVSLFQAVINALKSLGGSARPAEVVDQVAADLCISDLHRDELTRGGANKFDSEINWTRFYLAKAGIIDSSQRGVWTLTELGKTMPSMDHAAELKLFRDVRAEMPVQTEDKIIAKGSDEDSSSDDIETPNKHNSLVIDALLKLTSSGFEAFSQRLLREAGFQNVKVTGKSNDGGIDGIGILEINPLVSFKVLFQCKRYKDSVPASVIRDFRGAMAGRTDKGIILTTGRFTSAAKMEAVREGATPIELVDGNKLVDMLESLELGLKPVTAYEIDQSFFDEFDH